MSISDDAEPSVMSTDLPTGVYLLDTCARMTSGPPGTHRMRCTSPLGTLSETTGDTAGPRGVRDLPVGCALRLRRPVALAAGACWKTVNVADGMTGWAVAGRPMVSGNRRGAVRRLAA